jgi:hypothetical protein
MRIAVPVVALLLATGCTYVGEENESPTRLSDFPVVLDTVYSELPVRQETWLTTATYQPLYIGPPADTLFAGHRSLYSAGPAQGWLIDRVGKFRFKKPEPTGLVILVDTSQAMANEGEPMARHARHTPYKAYPVLLGSRDADTVYIGFGLFLNLVMEARTPSGSWASIERPFTYDCGTGLGTIVLPPGSVALTSAMIYTGPFATECRLRMGDNVLSNTFHASIDPQQFERAKGKYDE